MAFPTSPTNGQIYKNKMWRSSSNSWVDSSAIIESVSNAPAHTILWHAIGQWRS